MIDGWLLASLATWLVLHLGFAGWGRGYTLERGGGARGAVRVCVPARDERENIARCVRAALDDAGVAEVVVVDDGSSDGTADLAREAGRGDPRLIVRAAAERPPGWLGKPWACAEAARGASADWLLFVDADVVLAPGAAAAAIARAEREAADAVSLFGAWEVVTLAERVLVPAFGWLIRSVVDLRAVNGGTRAFANGQFLLVRRAPYERIGGHALVRGEILDDVRFAERARERGLALRLWWAPWAFRVRLYRSFGEVVAGYRKNLHEGLGRRKLATIGAAFATFATTALPPLAVPAFLVAGDPARAAVAAGITLLCVALRARVEARDGRPMAVAWLHPAAGAVIAFTLLASMSPGTWKGRRLEATRP